jgi:hypothetical protein
VAGAENPSGMCTSGSFGAWAVSRLSFSTSHYLVLTNAEADVDPCGTLMIMDLGSGGAICSSRDRRPRGSPRGYANSSLHLRCCKARGSAG